MSDPSLAPYLLRWEQAFARGDDIPAERLCADRPELIAKVQSLIERLREMHARERAGPSMRAVDSFDSPPTLDDQPPPTSTHDPTAETSGFQHVPRYEILREIARGGMGIVFEARQTGLNRLVALKMILADGFAAPEEHRRFLVQAEAIAKVRHPNIVQIFDLGTHEGRPFFSMELCPTSLGKRLGGAPMPARAAAELMEPIARAVHAAHGAKILHRDLKPANVLLAEDGRRTPRQRHF